MVKAMRDELEGGMRSRERYPEDPKRFIDQMTQELVEEKT